MITAQELQQAAPLDDGTPLKPIEADRILMWLRMIFDDAIEMAPRGAVGAALCAESHLLDSGQELTDAEIKRILDAMWWEGARCGEVQ